MDLQDDLVLALVMKHAFRKLILIGSACAPAAVLAFYFVNKFSLDVPVGDQWIDPLYLVIKAHSHQLTAHDLFAMVDGHRTFVIRVIAILASYINGFPQKLISLTTWFASWLNVLILSTLCFGDDLFKSLQKNPSIPAKLGQPPQA